MSPPVPAVGPLEPTRVTPRPLPELVATLRAGGDGAGGDPASRLRLVTVGPPQAGTCVTGVTHDSRRVRPGFLYAALSGSRVHGATFAAAAVASGAVAVLTDPSGQGQAAGTGVPVLVVPDVRAVLGEVASWAYGAPADKLVLVGITGTNGKTTTAYFVESGLRAAGHRTGLVGTIETRIAGRAVPSERTTPEATDLQALFAAMVERGVDAAAMEVSSHALALGRVDGTVYDVAVFTNLSQDHLDFHGDMAGYFAAKARLFTPQRCRRAVVDVDDEYGRALARSAAVPVATVSPDGRQNAHWQVTGVQAGATGSTVAVRGPGGSTAELSVRLPGAFNVDNALAAYVALLSAGVSAPAAAQGIADLAGVPGRMERVDLGQDFLAVVDYAHTPQAVQTLLAALRPVTAGRIVAVLGCGGDRDAGKRPLMGAALADGADVAILTSDNPRSEDPEAILAAMLDGAQGVPPGRRARLVLEPDRAEAISAAVAEASAGDTVVVAGKGHEQGQQIGDRTMAFDDRSVLAEALRRRVDGPPT